MDDHVKDHAEIGPLTKLDAFRENRDQLKDLETWFTLPSGNVQTTSTLEPPQTAASLSRRVTLLWYASSSHTLYRVRTLLSSSNSMTFHDFLHDLFKFSKTFGLAVSFKNPKPLLVLEHFLTLNSTTDTNSGVHQNECRYSSLSNIVLAFLSAVNNLSN